MADGSNLKNILARKQRGLGSVDDIMATLNDYSFGPFYFQVAVMFRNSMLVNSILTNSEAWYNLTDSDYNHLECADESLLRKILETGACTPKVMLYLELGIYPIRFVIMNRRVVFLHYILSRKGSLLHTFLEAQSMNPCKGDWSTKIIEDLNKLEISESFEEISKKSPEQFKNLVAKKIKVLAFEYLLMKKDKLDKVRHIKFEKLSMQEYLTPQQIFRMDSLSQAKFLFSLRSRMVQVRGNFKNNFENSTCELCGSHEDSQINLLTCKELAEPGALTNQPVDYEKLFSENPTEQIQIGAILKEKLTKRNKLLELKAKNENKNANK